MEWHVTGSIAWHSALRPTRSGQIWRCWRKTLLLGATRDEGGEWLGEFMGQPSATSQHQDTSISGWWFGTFFMTFHISGISSSQLTHIFQGGWNHQIDIHQARLHAKLGEAPNGCPQGSSAPNACHMRPLSAVRPGWSSFAAIFSIVGKTIINHPFGNGLYHLFMVIWGIVYYCFTHITYSDRTYQKLPKWLYAPADHIDLASFMVCAKFRCDSV